MPRPPSYTESAIQNGIRKITVSAWKYFDDLVRDRFMDDISMLFRGQRDSTWLLESTFHRLMKDHGSDDTSFTRTRHLRRFRDAVRGRRPLASVANPTDDEDWALGQHHGLATPLLDWSLSPFVAAYFAFESGKTSSSGFRSIFALHALPIQGLLKAARRKKDKVAEGNLIRVFRPSTGDNARLINQNGVFTIAPPGVTVNDWTKQHFAGVTDKIILTQIDVPERDRETCLSTLNRMNVSHLTLFPDLIGSCVYANFVSSIQGYRL